MTKRCKARQRCCHTSWKITLLHVIIACILKSERASMIIFTRIIYKKTKKKRTKQMTATGLEPSLAKWLSGHLRTKWLLVRVPFQSLKLRISCLFQARSSLTFRQLYSKDSL